MQLPQQHVVHTTCGGKSRIIDLSISALGYGNRTPQNLCIQSSVVLEVYEDIILSIVAQFAPNHITDRTVSAQKN
jgi:hypothetical protein